MCGHFAINYINLIKLMQRYGLTEAPAVETPELFSTVGFYPSRGASHSRVPVIRTVSGNGESHRALEMHRWDLVPGWWNKPLAEKKFATFNARDDGITEKATFRNAWKKSQRCIIPATEFFEWPDKKKIPSGVKRTEHRVSLKDQQIFSMAGIWEKTILDGEVLYSCTIITTDANGPVASIPHMRMPVILPVQLEAKWLDPAYAPSEALKHLKPYPSEKTLISS